MRTFKVCSVFGASGLLALCGGCSAPREPAPEAGERGSVGKQESALTDFNYTLDANPNLQNPERGIAYRVGATPPTGELDTLKFHFLFLGPVCNQNLVWNGRNVAGTSAVLNTWANTAVQQRDAGSKLIFRPRYDDPGREGLLNLACNMLEGDSYARMQNHVQAIARMLADPEIRPAVAFVEMGYLGSWGEWNTAKAEVRASCVPAGQSSPSVALCRPKSPVLLAASIGNDRNTFAKFVVDTYRAQGMTRAVGLRRPEFHNDLKAVYGTPSSHIGFYNDCFASGDVTAADPDSDSGTFTRIRWDYSDYVDLYPGSVLGTVTSAWNHVKAHALEGGNGGETCPSSTAVWDEPPKLFGRVTSDFIDYLHGSHAPGFRDAMLPNGNWDTLRSRLGYRYHATQVDYPASATPNASITVSVSIQNDGYGKIPYDRTAYIALHGPQSYVVGTSNPRSGTYAQVTPTFQSNQSVRGWNQGAPTVFTQTFPAPSAAGTYSIRLYIPDTDCVNNANCTDAVKNLYAVKLATKRGGASGPNVFHAATGTNDLGVTLTVSNGCAGGGNLVQNCDFASSTTGWHCGQGGGALATCSSVSGEHRTAITNPGTAAYHVQPNQQNLSLAGSTAYTVSFDARASVARTITVSVTENHDDFSSYSGVRTFSLGTSMAPYTFNFTMPPASDSNVKLEFGLGANGNNTVFLDNVVLKP